MDANDLLDVIGNADDKMLLAAKNYKKSRVNIFIKLGAAAACMCLIAGGMTAISHGINLPLPVIKK